MTENVKFHRIYAHTADGIVRNIGVTQKDERERLKEHLWEAGRGGRSHRLCWLRSLDQPPSVEVIEWIRPEDREERECYWIALFRDYGHNLVNETDGGDGMPGHKHTLETRAKMSAASLGKPKSPEDRRNSGLARMGRRHRPESCAQMSLTRMGKKLSPEHVAALTVGQTGNKRKNASSKYHGVFWSAAHSRWRAQGRQGGKKKHLGLFIEETGAARAVDVYIRANNLSAKLINFPMKGDCV